MSNSTQLRLSSRITATCGALSPRTYLCKGFTIPLLRLNKTGRSIGFDTRRRTTDLIYKYLMMGVAAIALLSKFLQFKVFSKGEGHRLGLFSKSHVYIRIYICVEGKNRWMLYEYIGCLWGVLRSVFLRTPGVPRGRRMG